MKQPWGRPGARSRGGKATAGITCLEERPNNQGVRQPDQKDEYPPVSTKESYQQLLFVTTALAHVRCIRAADNAGSGGFFGRQYNGYATTATAIPVTIPNDSTVEFVIGP